MKFLRQHLIDPEMCIRCNTCEETCPVDAITHNDDNYVVDAGKCDSCMDCISPCPTGSIDNWRTVLTAYTNDEQFEWEELPEVIDHGDDAVVDIEQQEAHEGEVAEILELAHRGQHGKVLAPYSAAHPYINIYDRERPVSARVTGNLRITGVDTPSDIHHLILDFGTRTVPVLEGQSISIIPPGTDAAGNQHVKRLYSIASAS